MDSKIVTLAKGGMAEKDMPVSKVKIPDLWHIAHRLDEEDKEKVLACWHLAHDLKTHIEDLP